ncbi:hypothetical protein PR048_013212, partial [Dryococelus australis]
MSQWTTTTHLFSWQKIILNRGNRGQNIAKNKKDIPLIFLTVKTGQQHSSMFEFKKAGILVCYIPRKIENVAKIDDVSGKQEKPEIMKFYNLTKGGVDVCGRLNERSISCIQKISQGFSRVRRDEHEDIPQFCFFCPRRKNWKMMKAWNMCEQPIRPEHSTYTCSECEESAKMNELTLT